MADLELVPAKTAVLCMDMQNFTVGHMPAHIKNPLLGATASVLDAARAGGASVIYIMSARRPEFSSDRNKFTSARGGSTPPSDPVAEEERRKIVAEIAPRDGEPIVRKPRMSAFYGSELQVMLTARNIDTLVLCGVATNFVVESTARYAVDADYRVILLQDCCAAGNEEVHQRALDSMEPMVHIASSKDFLTSVRS